MTDLNTTEFAKAIGTKKKTIENTVYKLKKAGTELGYIKDRQRYFTKEEQTILKQNLPKKSDPLESNLKEQIEHLKNTIETLENSLKKERESAELERSEMRQLLAQSNANLNQALEKNEQLQIEYNKEKNKGFFSKLFGK